MLLGAYDSGIPQTLDGIVQLEQSIGTTLPIIQLYSAWGDRPEHRFPIEVVTAIHDLGSTPLITWEPWLTEFDNGRHPEIALRDARERHGLIAVARGDYDFYIDAWAAGAREYGHPFFVRLAHEMNDPYRYPWGPQNNTKEEFIAAWRHIVERFDRRVHRTWCGSGHRTSRINTGSCTIRATRTWIGSRPVRSISDRSRSGRSGGRSPICSGRSTRGWRHSESR
ncbi:MAG TPA: hypothetical protein VIK25_14070 [Gemmatimonadaceae bacterium]